MRYQRDRWQADGSQGQRPAGGSPGSSHDREHTEHAVRIGNQNREVSGVVSSATGRGAHPRFVIDSCHAGAAVQAVREVREAELAAAASSVGDELRVAALTGLHQLKESLLAHCRQRETTGRELRAAIQQRRARTPGAEPAARDVVAELDAASTRVPDAFDRVAAQLWDDCIPLLNVVRMAVGHRQAPPRITDYRTLGAQLSYLDSLWNTVSQRIEHADPGAGATEPAKPEP